MYRFFGSPCTFVYFECRQKVSVAFSYPWMPITNPSELKLKINFHYQSFIVSRICNQVSTMNPRFPSSAHSWTNSPESNQTCVCLFKHYWGHGCGHTGLSVISNGSTISFFCTFLDKLSRVCASCSLSPPLQQSCQDPWRFNFFYLTKNLFGWQMFLIFLI